MNRRVLHRRRRALAHQRAVPTFVALLHVAVLAGQTPRQALASVLAGAPTAGLGALSTTLAPLAHAVGLGADLSQALLAAERHGPVPLAVVRVVDLLRRAEVDGLDLGLHLEIMIGDVRRERAHGLDVAAQQLTVALLFPLVLCVLPAFVLLAIAPLVLEVVAQLPA